MKKHNFVSNDARVQTRNIQNIENVKPNAVLTTSNESDFFYL